MLILVRRKGEAIIIDDKIKIHLLSIKSNFARIGIHVPKKIIVCRQEIYKDNFHKRSSRFEEDISLNDDFKYRAYSKNDFSMIY